MQHPAYPKRFSLPNAMVPWTQRYDDYKPEYYEPVPRFDASPYAPPSDPVDPGPITEPEPAPLPEPVPTAPPETEGPRNWLKPQIQRR